MIIAEERALRPHDFCETIVRRPDTICPFCEGNEHLTPSERLAIRKNGSEPNGPGWQVRAFENRYPVLRPNGQPADTPSRETVPGVKEDHLIPAVGEHWVIVETPRHLRSVTDLTESELADVLRVYQNGFREVSNDRRLRYAQLFKNVGPGAGASIEHLHSQLIATPFLPPNVERELASTEKYYRHEGRCLFCDLLEQEEREETRLVARSDGFVAVAPYASRFAYETWILPSIHSDHFMYTEESQLDHLAQILHETLRKIETVLGTASYNYLFHATPFDNREARHYHWHIEIVPRTGNLAGFEWGTGCYINPVSPEKAARQLRDAV